MDNDIPPADAAGTAAGTAADTADVLAGASAGDVVIGADTPTGPATTAGTPAGSADVTIIDIPIGRRVMVVSDLLLTPVATPSSLALTNELATTLDSWSGPGVLIIAGNLFDLTGDGTSTDEARAALQAHPRLQEAAASFLDGEERRIIRQQGTHEPEFDTDPGAVVAAVNSGTIGTGMEQAGPVDLRLQTSTGLHTVRVEPGEHAYASQCTVSETEFDPAADSKPGAVQRSLAGDGWRSLAEQSEDDAPWLEGLHRLSDPSALSRFVTSRLLYRRLGRYAWWLLVPFAVAVLLRFLITPNVIRHAGTGVAGRALRHVHQAGWASRLSVATLFALIVLAVLALVLGLLSRRAWSVLGGGTLSAVRTEARANDTARDAARTLVALGPHRTDHRSDISTGADQPGDRLLRQRGRHHRSGGGAGGSVGAATGLRPSATVELGRTRNGRRSPRTAPPGRDRSPLEQLPRARWSPSGGWYGPCTRRWWPRTREASRGRRRPISAKPIAGPSEYAGWPLPPSWLRELPTSSMPSLPRSEDTCTCCWRSFPCGRPKMPAPWSPWPVWGCWRWAVASCEASAGRGVCAWRCWSERSSSTCWPVPI